MEIVIKQAYTTFRSSKIFFLVCLVLALCCSTNHFNLNSFLAKFCAKEYTEQKYDKTKYNIKDVHCSF